MNIDTIALWIGYAVMVAGGIGIALLLLWLAAEGIFKVRHYGMNMGDVDDALRAWRTAHPEKFLRWKKRNNEVN